MKKLFLTVLAAVMCMASGANAAELADSKDVEKKYEFVRACEVCPYYDDEMCRSWTPDCPEEEASCLYKTLSACDAKCSGTCKLNGSCYDCYLSLPECGTNQYRTETWCKKQNTGTGSCKQDSTTTCWYFVAAQTTDTTGDTGDDDTTTGTAADTTPDTNTISDNCPTGTKKSADGCCCVPN